MPLRTSSAVAKAPRKLTLEERMDRLAQKATGASSPETGAVRLSQVTNTLWLGNSDAMAEAATVVDVMQTMEELAPRDGFERMLINQMMAVHHATMECFRRAMISQQSFEGRDSNLKHAQKLTAMYAVQLETLNKHRGKGQQKVTVEHVNVAAGGQAIVGNVETRSAPGGAAEQQKAPPQIAHQVDRPNPLEALDNRPASKISRTRASR